MIDYRSVASHIFIPHYDHKRPFDREEEFKGAKPLHVEIGFGQGEFLLNCLQEQPDVSFVGIELDWGRIRKCFKKIGHWTFLIQFTLLKLE